jgi:hypothetical protein
MKKWNEMTSSQKVSFAQIVKKRLLIFNFIQITAFR